MYKTKFYTSRESLESTRIPFQGENHRTQKHYFLASHQKTFEWLCLLHLWKLIHLWHCPSHSQCLYQSMKTWSSFNSNPVYTLSTLVTFIFIIIFMKLGIILLLEKLCFKEYLKSRLYTVRFFHRSTFYSFFFLKVKLAVIF